MSSTALESVYLYHDGTKHYPDHFAPSLGYLDWASQPRPFRSYIGSPEVALERRPRALSRTGQPGKTAVTYDELFASVRIPAVPITIAAIGDMLRHALGLSAWKAIETSRWALRVNPSSGNLHPTEAYLVTGPLPELSTESAVWHYAPDSHSIEQRCTFPSDAWPFGQRENGTDAFLVALTSIHWRESWKYGERGFRYCQHDIGHAIGALSMAAAVCGWQLVVQPRCSHDWIATLIGIDRDQDYVEAEREDAACLMLVSARATPPRLDPDRGLADAARRGRWFGRASQLSEDHVHWTFIETVAAATRDPGNHGDTAAPGRWKAPVGPVGREEGRRSRARSLDARGLMLQRRSAVALDGLSSIDRSSFVRMLTRLLPRACAPWETLWWTPRIHLAIFVHRVRGLQSGLYALVRDSSARSRMEAAFDAGFEWESVDADLPFYRLAAGAFRSRSQRLSCDQAIAADGFFSVAMLAEFDRSLNEQGPWFYRNLFWESGLIGQALYLESEAAGARGTGIGCFYDDAVHETLGLRGHAFQSLYLFTVGMPVEDGRLTTEPGYKWE